MPKLEEGGNSNIQAKKLALAASAAPRFVGTRTAAKILTVFGTRPEAIKLAPVIRELNARSPKFTCVNVISSQHTSLLQPFVRLFDLDIHYDLEVMRPEQTPNQVCAQVISLLEPILIGEKPDLLLVQGDTTTALAGALAGFHQGISVGHVEAGLRTGDPQSPFPEEMNRTLISRLATLHFAATELNRTTLLAEGIPSERIFLTGNPVVDALHFILRRNGAPTGCEEVLASTQGLRRVVLTTHRRESFAQVMLENLRVLRRFVEEHPDVGLIFPVHPNPNVTSAADSALAAHPRIHLIPPLGYPGFIHLLSQAWLIVSDSGGVQEEAPTLGRPVLILREKTERPEAVQCGVARLVGGAPSRLRSLLEETHRDPSWEERVRRTANPFGSGDSGRRIVDAIEEVFCGAACT